jgi:GTPase
LVLPQLPDTTAALSAPARPGKLLAGLESSRGALYEIGVSDSGVLVGLTEDEMEESLTNLKAMAASLGCVVEVTRMVVVGECEWYQMDTSMDTLGAEVENLSLIAGTDESRRQSESQVHHAKLWVAEALVTPDLSSVKTGTNGASPNGSPRANIATPELDRLRAPDSTIPPTSSTEQLRVTLTGPTTSGKSSLLGTLSTATLDNGRGKSRLSLLKHRHELASGMTSSVAQELLGYIFCTAEGTAAEVVNYATGNVTTWTDIHARSENGRLVFVSDSAGHPRYRRTTVRGLVGWAPHWTLLCIAADDGANAPHGAGGTSSAQDILGTIGVGIDLSKAHLDLCLQLEKPLGIVITKLDLASRASLRDTLAKILSAIKAVGRIPAILQPDQTKNILESDLETVPQFDADAVRKIINTMTSGNLTKVVPIIMTSAAKGTGIRMLHSLLSSLPIPSTPTSHDYVGEALNPEQPGCLFHVEDTFTLPAAFSMQTSRTTTHLDTGTVVAGYLRFGSLSIGDRIVVGPFPADHDSGSDDDAYVALSSSHGRKTFRRYVNDETDLALDWSSSHPSASELSRIAKRNAPAPSAPTGEWNNAHIVSIRNLRLPVHRLEAGQVGTIGIVFDMLDEEEVSNGPFERLQPQAPRLRKGMVLAIPSHHMKETGLSLQAASGFTASFQDGDVNSVTPGSLVVIYIASIRASARVIRLMRHAQAHTGDNTGDEDEPFGEEEGDSETSVFGSDGITDVTLELMTTREWIELGSQVLIMPGGGQGLYYGSERGEKGVAGLEGFVGKVIEVVD